jgi:hypothetical protein
MIKSHMRGRNVSIIYALEDDMRFAAKSPPIPTMSSRTKAVCESWNRIRGVRMNAERAAKEAHWRLLPAAPRGAIHVESHSAHSPMAQRTIYHMSRPVPKSVTLVSLPFELSGRKSCNPVCKANDPPRLIT